MIAGEVSHARVGLHELCPTLLELTGQTPFDVLDSCSFAAVLRDPHKERDNFSQGFAEYFGGRMILTQRVLWDGPWKFVFNGFDFDELYNLDNDPYELRNLAEDPAHVVQLHQMTDLLWQKIAETGDHSLLRSHYPILRVAPHGPLGFSNQ